jgi:hypothetical protein
MDQSNTRIIWLAVGIAYGAVAGAIFGRRLLRWQLDLEARTARYWDLERRLNAIAGERETAKQAKPAKAAAE